jgi:hypothetical protein
MPKKQSAGFVIASKEDTVDVWFSGKKLVRKIVVGG